MPKIIGVVSGKGGVGKTVTSINLGAALSQLGLQNTIVDADVSSANLTIHLGLPEAIVSLQDVLAGRKGIQGALRILPNGLRVIPSSLAIRKKDVDLSGLGNAVKALGGLAILDAPPGFNRDTKDVISACDELLVVANPEAPSITDAVKTIEIAKDMEKGVLGVIVNRVQNKPFEITQEEIEDLCEVPVLSVVPEDTAMKKAVFRKTPLVFMSPNSPAAIEYKRLAAKMLGKPYSPPKFLMLRRLLG